MKGKLAEQLAEKHLLQQGLKLVERNFRSRFGEIDLIMQDGEMLVFVEVRLRSSADFGGAAASIDSHKQQRLTRTARLYLAQIKRYPPCRFDAVLIDDQQERKLQWLKNAFEA